MKALLARLWLVGILSLTTAACNPVVPHFSGTELCDPGAVSACQCGPNATGTQVCNSTGSAYSACDCLVVSVTPSTATLSTNAQLTLVASVTNGPNGNVLWTVSGPSGGAVSAAGVYTAPAAPGTYAVVATSASDATRSATATITVVPAPVTPTIAAPSPVVTNTANLVATIADAIAGLTYEWTLSNGTFQSAATGPSITFTAGTVGYSLLTVNVTNAAGDTALPANLVLNVLAALPPGYSPQILTPSEVVTKVGPVTASIANQLPGTTYTWQLTAGTGSGTIIGSATGPSIGYTGTGEGTLQLNVTATVTGVIGGGVEGTPLTITVIDSDQSLAVLAGQVGGPGYLDGPPGIGRLGFPVVLGAVPPYSGTPAYSGLSVDPNGNIYLAEPQYNVIRKVTPDGTLSTFAGTGVAGYSNATPATFSAPEAVAVAKNGSILVADSGNCAIRQISGGTVTTIAGAQPGGASGCTPNGATGPTAVATATFGHMHFVATTSDSEVFFDDVTCGVDQVVGDAVNNFCVCGPPDNTVEGLAANPGDATNTLYMLTPVSGLPGPVTISNSVLMPSLDCAGLAYRLPFMSYAPAPLAIDANLDLLTIAPGPFGGIGGTPQSSIIETLFRSGSNYTTANGVTVAGSGPAGLQNGTGGGASFAATGDGITSLPLSVSASPAVVISDVDNGVIREMTFASDPNEGIVTTLPAGVPAHAGDHDDVGTAALLDSPFATAVLGDGTIYFYSGDFVPGGGSGISKIKRLTADGSVTTFAGSTFGARDGSLAQFGTVVALAGTADGNLLALDINTTATLRTISSTTGEVVTVMGGNGGFVDGVAGVGELTGSGNGSSLPPSVTQMSLASDGSVLIADTNNNAIRRYQAGLLSTVAGGSGQFSNPRGVTSSPSGIIYVGDTSDQVIGRVVTTSTAVTVTAIGRPPSNGSPWTSILDSSDCATARMVSPSQIVALPNGDLLFVDDRFVRRVWSPETACSVSTVIGDPLYIAVQAGSTLLPATVTQPASLALSPNGDLIFTDMAENVVLRARF